MFSKVILIAALAIVVQAEKKMTEEQQKIRLPDFLRGVCEKNGGNIKDIENVWKNYLDCIRGTVDADTIRMEIGVARPNGTLDMVLKKYCGKSPQLKTCIHNLASGLTPCLEAHLRENIGTVKNSTSQLIDFLCYKDGERITSFISEGGPQCFQEKMPSIQQCVTKLKSFMPNDEAIKRLTVNEQCKKFDEMSECMVNTVRECSSPISGDLTEALFKLVRKATLCDSIPVH